jgi:hypothetical protein
MVARVYIMYSGYDEVVACVREYYAEYAPVHAHERQSFLTVCWTSFCLNEDNVFQGDPAVFRLLDLPTLVLFHEWPYPANCSFCLRM